MTQFDADFDYLELLGVEPQDVLRNAAALAGVVRERKKDWTAQALNPLYQQEARSRLERVREFEWFLSKPQELAAYIKLVLKLRAAARGAHEAKVVSLLTLACEGRRTITSPQRDLLVKEAKAESIPEGLVQEVLRARSFTVEGVRPAAVPEKPKLPLRSPALDRVVFNDLQKWLKVLDKGSLYELLDLPLASQPSRLLAAARLLFAHWSKILPKTNQSTAWEKTLQGCLTYLKDPEQKAKYDRALYNARVQKFADRVDLVLAGGVFGAAEQSRLARIGVEEFGLTEEVIRQCLAARLAESGMSLPGEIAPVVVHLQGQIRCRRCGLWCPPKQPQCRSCGGSLHHRCENPACRSAPLPIDSKACPECGLAVSRGVQYRNLLHLADAFLESGSHAAAMSVCQRAEQIHPGPAVSERVARAAQVRELLATLRRLAAANAWTAVAAGYKHLLAVAPRAAPTGVPSLEKISDFLADATKRLRSLPDEPVQSAKICLEFLNRWSDCEEAVQRLLGIVGRLESDGQPRLAQQLLGRLLEIRPGDDVLRGALGRLEQNVRQDEAQKAERASLLAEYDDAVGDARLYAAEVLLARLERLPGGAPPGAATVRQRLGEVRRELGTIEQATAGGTARESVLERYLVLLRRCRDCREALRALQSITLDPPAAPEVVAIRLEGSRRVLTWNPASGGRPATAFAVQRSISRPGSRQGTAPFQTIAEVETPFAVDDEVVHGGSIVRYMVHSVARSSITLEGEVLRSYELVSAPIAAPALLSWQEAINARSTRHPGALELTWYQPPGARRTLIERWPGGPEQRGAEIAIRPLTTEGRLLDEGLEPGVVFTYCIRSIFDGPEGEFYTPGITLTDAALGPSATSGAIEQAHESVPTGSVLNTASNLATPSANGP